MFFMERDFACSEVENEFLDRLHFPLLFAQKASLNLVNKKRGPLGPPDSDHIFVNSF